MPNNITNRLNIIADKDRIREILEAVQDDEHGLGSVDFNKIIPMPEDIYRGDLGAEEKALYGEKNWYDWSVQNWGTKWDSYGYEDFPKYESGSEILFMTAWSRPEPVIVKLSEMFPDAQFQHAWADEDIGSNVGEILYQNGEELEIDIPSRHSKEAYEMASDIQGLELSEFGLYYNDEAGNYEYRDPDEEQEETSTGDVYVGQDFQCDQTSGYPTVLVWNQDNGTAILQPAPAFDDDSELANQCIRDCAEWGVRACNDWEDYNDLLESLGRDAAENVVPLDDEGEREEFGGLTLS